MIDTKTAFAALLLMSSVSLSVLAEEQPAATNPGNQTASSETDEASPETETPAQDTRGGAGLKERKLSVIFEQFVPTETISADNAVPFPTDI